MDLVFKGYDAAVTGRMHDQRIAAIKPNVVTVSRIKRHKVWPDRALTEANLEIRSETQI